MKIIFFLLSSLIFCSHAFCEDKVVFKSEVICSEAFTTMDDIGNVQYHTINKQYHFMKDILEPYPFLLIYEEKEESQFLGDEVSKSKIKLTAWSLKEGKVTSELWTIENNGHRWEVIKGEVIIISKGCCDRPDKKYIFDLKSGKLKNK